MTEQDQILFRVLSALVTNRYKEFHVINTEIINNIDKGDFKEKLFDDLKMKFAEYEIAAEKMNDFIESIKAKYYDKQSDG